MKLQQPEPEDNFESGTIGRILQVLSQSRRLSPGPTQTLTNKDATPETPPSHVGRATPEAPGALEGQRRGPRQPPAPFNHLASALNFDHEE